MRTRILMTAALGAAVLAMGACADTGEPEGGYRIDSQNAVHPILNTVRVIDGSLARYVGGNYKVETVLDVENVVVSPTATGFPGLSVELRNKSKVAIPLEVRASWYDAAGASSDPAQSWSHVFLQPMSTSVFQTSSIKQSSKQYYVEVRGAQ
jgi:uncharacterized protein YcfL